MSKLLDIITYPLIYYMNLLVSIEEYGIIKFYNNELLKAYLSIVFSMLLFIVFPLWLISWFIIFSIRILGV